MNAMPKFSPADFASDQEVRWCPGCGDYSILKAVQRTLSQIGAKPENTVCVSGIGCSSRFPYYLETYGFHTIHGRAPAIATGVKLANPELDVWIVTGDGDGTVDRRQSHVASLAPQPGLSGSAVQQRDLRIDQGSMLADEPRRHPFAIDTVRFGGKADQSLRVRARGRRAIRRPRVRRSAEQAARQFSSARTHTGERASSRSIRTASSTMMERSKSSQARKRPRTRCSGSRQASRCCLPTARKACGSTENA